MRVMKWGTVREVEGSYRPFRIRHGRNRVWLFTCMQSINDSLMQSARRMSSRANLL